MSQVLLLMLALLVWMSLGVCGAVVVAVVAFAFCNVVVFAVGVGVIVGVDVVGVVVGCVGVVVDGVACCA